MFNSEEYAIELDEDSHNQWIDVHHAWIKVLDNSRIIFKDKRSINKREPCGEGI